MDTSKPVTAHRLVLSNPMAYSYHIAKIPEAPVLDPSKTHFKETNSKTLKMTTEQNKRAATFTGRQQGEQEHNQTAHYLALVKGPTGEYNVIPLKNWYNFQKDASYATLTTEDAEKLLEPRRAKKEQKKSAKKEEEPSKSEEEEEELEFEEREGTRGKGKKRKTSEYVLQKYRLSEEGIDYDVQEEFPDDDERLASEHDDLIPEEEKLPTNKLTMQGKRISSLMEAQKNANKEKEADVELSASISEDSDVSEEEEVDESSSLYEEEPEAGMTKRKKIEELEDELGEGAGENA